MMTDFAFAGVAEFAFALARSVSSCGSVSPPRPIAPARSHSRRLRWFASSGETSLSIAFTPERAVRRDTRRNALFDPIRQRSATESRMRIVANDSARQANYDL